MWLSYDPEADASYIRLTDEVLAPGRESVACELPSGSSGDIVLDFKDGKLVAIEVLGASGLLPADLLAQAIRRP